MSKIETAANFIASVCYDDAHGYDQNDRMGNPNYDCSGLVISAWESAGVNVKENGANTTANMYNAFLASGFIDATYAVNLNTGEGLVRGDVLLKIGQHTAMFVGNGWLAEASSNENGEAIGGQSGDQTGQEVWVHNYYNHPWDCVLRYNGPEDALVPGLGSILYHEHPGNPAYMDFGVSYTFRGDNTNYPARFRWMYYKVSIKQWIPIVDWTASNWISIELPEGDYIIGVEMYDDNTVSASLIDKSTMNFHSDKKGKLKATALQKQSDTVYQAAGMTDTTKGYVTIMLYDVDANAWTDQHTVNNVSAWASFDVTPGKAYWLLFRSFDPEGNIGEEKTISFVA